jgi:murein DD-endopeptidase MepM/ murein hydrolase activator NlpD
LNLLIALAMTLSAGQGEAVLLQVPVEAALAEVQVTWDDRQIPLASGNAGWFAILGVDLETEPGEYPARLAFTYADGTVATRTEMVTVTGRQYPTTHLKVAPKYVDLSDENQVRTAAEREEISAIYATLTPDAYWQEPFQVPIPGTTGGRNFGQRRVFNDQPRSPHSGADLKAATGVPVEAANRGRVALAKNLFFSGNAVFIDHGLGVYTVYLHLSEIQVSAGDMVARGQVVGLAGATGRVTGPHLHWGVRVLDARVDPFSLLTLE